MCHVCHHVRTLLLVRADVLGSVLNDNRIHDELHLHEVSIVCATRAIMREHVCVRVCARASMLHDQVYLRKSVYMNYSNTEQSFG